MADILMSELPKDLRHVVSLAQEKGASSWSSSLSIQHGFALHKGGFRDALVVRYGWTPKEVPVECTCGKFSSVEHALSCNRGGFPTLKHKTRDITATPFNRGTVSQCFCGANSS